MGPTSARPARGLLRTATYAYDVLIAGVGAIAELIGCAMVWGGAPAYIQFGLLIVGALLIVAGGAGITDLLRAGQATRFGGTSAACNSMLTTVGVVVGRPPLQACRTTSR